MNRKANYNDTLPLVLLVIVASILSPFVLNKQSNSQYISSYSFPADTVIQSSEGPIPISRVYPGMMIKVYNPLRASWENQAVSLNTERSYSGSLMEISMGDVHFQVTSGHLFLVESGEALDERRLPVYEIPADLPEVDGANWIMADKLQKGDFLASFDGPVQISKVEEIKNSSTQVFSLSLERGQVYAVSGKGIAAADRSLVRSDSVESDSHRSGGCFPQGTLVETTLGPRPIEILNPGDTLWTMSPDGLWQERVVEELIHRPYSGEMVKIQLEDETLTATANHPYLVEGRGRSLQNRPRPEDLGSDPSSYDKGFWVEAGDLEVGDRLVTRYGTQRVLELERNQEQLTVYNLRVKEHHNYAVGSSAVLVHNKGAAEETAIPEEYYESSESMGDLKEPAIEGESKREDFSFSEEPSSKDRGASGSGPAESGLKAGYADDNQQFNYFLRFLEEYKSVNHFELDVRERIRINLQDTQGSSLPNQPVRIFSGSTLLCRGKTLSDGSFYFFPSEYNGSIDTYRYEIDIPGSPLSGSFARMGERELLLEAQVSAEDFPVQNLDIVFVLDTTGSMGGEIQRLKDTIEIIKLNLSSVRGLNHVRFGLQLYKDRGDEYITRSTLITDDLEAFQEDLDAVYASGGGDGPEDLQAALDSALNRMNWDPQALRLAFIITDAPPHLDYENSVSYVDSARLAREKGIKLFSVGTGGLDTGGEYVLRQISQYTGARYIFLTYGESGESEGGVEGSVSHHTGENFSTDKLESIIIQFAREELSHILPISMDGSDEYFTARPVDSESREETLRKLFDNACHQLVDYSSLNLEAGTPTALTPFSLRPGADPAQLEFLEAQLQYTLASQSGLKELFTLVERRNLQQILDELKLSLTGVIDEDSSVEIGKFLGAQWIITGDVHPQGDELHIFLKLMRVETGEILSITKVVIPESLLP